MPSPIGPLLHHLPEWALSWWDGLYKLPLGKYHIPYENIVTRFLIKEQKEEFSLRTTYREPEVALPWPQWSTSPQVRYKRRRDAWTQSLWHANTHADARTLFFFGVCTDACMFSSSPPSSSSKRTSQGGFHTHGGLLGLSPVWIKPLWWSSL